MGELEQMAVQTFSMVPEIYQQAFRDSGADFPDELVAQIKQDPNQAIELLSNDKNLLQAVVDIYKNNQEAINQYAEQAASQMFKKGGKLAYGLEKFKCGGKTKKYQTPSGELPKRLDGVRGEAYTQILEDGSQKKTLTRRNNDGTVDYTTQTVSPQNDTTYTTWRNAGDREIHNFITPYTYNNLP